MVRAAAIAAFSTTRKNSRLSSASIVLSVTSRCAISTKTKSLRGFAPQFCFFVFVFGSESYPPPFTFRRGSSSQHPSPIHLVSRHDNTFASLGIPSTFSEVRETLRPRHLWVIIFCLPVTLLRRTSCHQLPPTSAASP